MNKTTYKINISIFKIKILKKTKNTKKKKRINDKPEVSLTRSKQNRTNKKTEEKMNFEAIIF
jgi:hypothetical protein